MTTLRSRIILHHLKGIPSVSAFKVCQELQPYIKLHQITFTDQAIYFPETDPLLSALQATVPEIVDSPRNRILLTDVIDMTKTDGILEIFLKTGFVHTLSSDKAEHKVFDIYPDEDITNASRLQRRWWTYSGKIQKHLSSIKEKLPKFAKSKNPVGESNETSTSEKHE